MKKFVLAFSLFCMHPYGFALLSPLNQSIDEIQSIIQNAELQKYLPQDQSLIAILQTNNGYLLQTEKLKILVEIEYLPIEKPGKKQFKIIFHESSPIENSL